MTTIAYCHNDKTVSCDSRMTSGSLIISDEDVKFTKTDKGVFFGCGSVSDMGDFIGEFDWKKKEASRHFDVSFFVVKDQVVHITSVEDGCIWITELKHDRAIGCGASFALGAMDHGKGSKGALVYAAQKDVFTGGRIVTYDVLADVFEGTKNA